MFINEVNKANIRRNFNRAAEKYDRYAVIQKDVALELFEKYIKNIKIKNVRNILEIGTGTGIFTELLGSYFNHDNSIIYSIDFSENMLKIAKSRLYKHPNLRFFLQDAENISYKKISFDLIVSNLTFQWLTKINKTLQDYSRLLSNGGYLIFSIMGRDTFIELKQAFFSISPGELNLLPSNHFIDKEILQYYLSSYYREVDIEERHKQVIYDSLLIFLKILQYTGGINSSVVKTRLSTIRKLIKINKNNPISCTYHVIYAKAKK